MLDEITDTSTSHLDIDMPAIRRFGVLDRTAAKVSAKTNMDGLWALERLAKQDLSVNKFEHASFASSLETVERELHHLLLPIGEKAILPDEL